MNTINISLTPDQARQVNQATTDLGFANRSEFFRALLRRVFASSTTLEEIKSWPFVSPTTRSPKKITSEFKKTKQYSKEFLTDLKEGLENSPYFR